MPGEGPAEPPSRGPALERALRAFGMPLVLLAGIAALVLVGRAKPGRKWVLLPEAEAAAVTNPHDYQGQPVCQRCHPYKDVRLAPDPDAECAACHEFHQGNHPVGVPQPVSADAPFLLPLGPGHTVACHSCHDPHDVKRLQDGLRLPFNDLCVVCHPGR